MSRIAIFHNLPSGGAKRTLFEWTVRLAKRHSIDVFSLSTANHSYCDLKPYAQNYLVYDFLPHRLFRSPFGRLNQVQRWRDLRVLENLNQSIAAIMNKSGYDIVFANTCIFTFIPSLVCFTKSPAVYYLHEPFGDRFRREINRPYFRENNWRAFVNRIDPFIPLYHKRLDRIQRRSIHSTKLLLSNSFFTKGQMKKDFGINAPVSYSGVNTEIFKPIHSTKESHVLSVGELSPRKGFDFLIESISLLPKEKRPTLRLVANQQQSEERDYLVKMAQIRGVNLEILANLNAEQLAIEYNKVRVLVYSPVLEPFGQVPLEAMACGTPVVAVAEGGVKESVVHNRTGFMVERQPSSFASALETLLDNPDLAQEFGENGRELVLDKWTWDHSTEVLEQFLLGCA